MLFFKFGNAHVFVRNLFSQPAFFYEIHKEQNDCEKPNPQLGNFCLQRRFFFFENGNLLFNSFLFGNDFFSRLAVIVEQYLRLVLIDIVRFWKNFTCHDFYDFRFSLNKYSFCFDKFFLLF